MTDQEQPNDDKRLSFHEDTERRSMDFAREILDAVPELESVAVVLSYEVPQPELACAVVMGQHGPLSRPAELMHMMQQLGRTFTIQAQNSYAAVQQIDKFMTEQAAALAELEKKIDERKRELAQLDNE